MKSCSTFIMAVMFLELGNLCLAGIMTVWKTPLLDAQHHAPDQKGIKMPVLFCTCSCCSTLSISYPLAVLAAIHVEASVHRSSCILVLWSIFLFLCGNPVNGAVFLHRIFPFLAVTAAYWLLHGHCSQVLCTPVLTGSALVVYRQSFMAMVMTVKM